MSFAYTSTGARLSRDGVYRYSLVRLWEGGAATGRLLFVMLNPSTADSEIDDPTIRKCVGFAKRKGFESIEVVNLYAYRATDPGDLWAFTDDRVGPDNDDAIREAAAHAKSVVVAWGAHSREAWRERDVTKILREHHPTLYCLGTTTKHPYQPRHPLMVAYATELAEFKETYR